MMDMFRGQVAEEILRVVLTHFYRMGFGAGYGFEDWSHISPDLSMSRKQFELIKEDVSGLVDQNLHEAVDRERFFQQITPKIQAISSQAECDKIVAKIKELLERKPGMGQQKVAIDVGQLDSSQVPGVLQKQSPPPSSELEVQAQYSSRKEQADFEEESDANGLNLNVFFGSDEQARVLAGRLIQDDRKDLIPKLLELLKKAPMPILKACLLRLLPGSDYVKVVYDFLEDEDPRVLATAIEALEQIGDEDAYARISTYTNHVHNRVKANAIKAMHKLSPQKMMDILSRMSSSEYSAYRDSAMFVMCTLADPAFIDLMERHLGDEEATVRDKALQGLQYLAIQGNEKAREIVERAIKKQPNILGEL